MPLRGHRLPTLLPEPFGGLLPCLRMHNARLRARRGLSQYPLRALPSHMRRLLETGFTRLRLLRRVFGADRGGGDVEPWAGPVTIDYSSFAHPKPADRARQPVRTYPGGREVCDLTLSAGKRIYGDRISEMLERQKQMCCLYRHAPSCPGFLRRHEATFEHQNGRGSGGSKRDDRTCLPDGTWINGAAHSLCNAWKGSRYIEYNRAFQPRNHQSPVRG